MLTVKRSELNVASHDAKDIIFDNERSSTASEK